MTESRGLVENLCGTLGLLVFKVILWLFGALVSCITMSCISETPGCRIKQIEAWNMVYLIIPIALIFMG